MDFSFEPWIHGHLLGPYYAYMVRIITRQRAVARFHWIFASIFQLISCLGKTAQHACEISPCVCAHLLSSDFYAIVQL